MWHFSSEMLTACTHVWPSGGFCLSLHRLCCAHVPYVCWPTVCASVCCWFVYLSGVYRLPRRLFSRKCVRSAPAVCACHLCLPSMSAICAYRRCLTFLSTVCAYSMCLPSIPTVYTYCLYLPPSIPTSISTIYTCRLCLHSVPGGSGMVHWQLPPPAGRHITCCVSGIALSARLHGTCESTAANSCTVSDCLCGPTGTRHEEAAAGSRPPAAGC